MARRNENSSVMMLILAIGRQPVMDLLGYLCPGRSAARSDALQTRDLHGL
jgi:hypothetical protein